MDMKKQWFILGVRAHLYDEIEPQLAFQLFISLLG
jgi:hypothetical protein